MKYKVNQIQFDFDDCPYCEKLQSPEHDAECDGFVEVKTVTQDVMSRIWNADDKDDLAEKITCTHGWYIKSIDYVLVPS